MAWSAPFLFMVTSMRRLARRFVDFLKSVDIGDILILSGLAAVLVGLYLVDLRLALIVGGLVLIVSGLFRLRLAQHGARR